MLPEKKKGLLMSNNKIDFSIHVNFLLFILIVLSLVLFYPGFMADDSHWALMQARESYYNDWHSPLYSYLWHYVDLVISGPFGMLVIQTVLYWTGLYLIFTNWGFKNRFTSYIVLILVGLFPPIFSFLGVILKGALMDHLLILLFSIALILDRKNYTNYPALAAIGLLLIVATALRHNSIGSVLVFIWYLSYLSLDVRKPSQQILFRLIITFFIALLLSLFIKVVSGAVNDAIKDEKGNVWQYIVAFDIAGISVFTDDESRKSIEENVYKIKGFTTEREFELHNVRSAYFRKPIYYKRLYDLTL